MPRVPLSATGYPLSCPLPALGPPFTTLQGARGFLPSINPPKKRDLPPYIHSQKNMLQRLINNLKHMETYRKQQRNHPTEAEAYLWHYLRKRKLAGKKFRRQFSVGNFIVDFICWEEKLAIELDGQHHYTEEGKLYDKQRDAWLQSEGIRVMRFENARVFRDIKGVLLEIEQALNPPAPF